MTQYEMPSNAFLLCRLWSKVQQWASTPRPSGHANHRSGESKYWRYNQRPPTKLPTVAVFQHHQFTMAGGSSMPASERNTMPRSQISRWSHPRDVFLQAQEEILWSRRARNPRCACNVQCTRLSPTVPVHIWHCRGDSGLRAYIPPPLLGLWRLWWWSATTKPSLRFIAWMTHSMLLNTNKYKLWEAMKMILTTVSDKLLQHRQKQWSETAPDNRIIVYIQNGCFSGFPVTLHFYIIITLFIVA